MENQLKKIFGKYRIIGLAGEKNSGKSNNLYYLIKNFREYNKTTEIYAFGLSPELNPLLKQLNIGVISSLKQLIHKENCLLILDEFQLLKLNDRRYKDQLQEFINFVYHRNVYVILSSPDIREFNSIIGGIVEKWLLKTVRIDQCINGSQLKKVVDEYRGSYKSLGSIVMPKDKILVINNEEETIITCDYEKEADTKKDLINIFENDKKLSEKKTEKC